MAAVLHMALMDRRTLISVAKIPTRGIFLILLFGLVSSCSSSSYDEKHLNFITGGDEAEAFYDSYEMYIEDRIYECMRDQGFLYDPESRVEHVVSSDSGVEDVVGYGIVESLRMLPPSPTEPEPTAPHDAPAVEAYDKALFGNDDGSGGCVWDATEAADSEFEMDLIRSVSLAYSVERSTWSESLEGFRYEDQWRECMAGQGFEFVSRDEIARQVEELWFATVGKEGSGDDRDVLAFEVAAHSADGACRDLSFESTVERQIAERVAASSAEVLDVILEGSSTR